MKLEYKISEEMLSSLDWITVTDLSDEDQASGNMAVIDCARIGDDHYLLAIEAEDDASISEDWDDEEDPDEEAFLLKLCNKSEAEFLITEEYSDLEIYATTDMTEEEFNKASAVLAEQASDEYDVIIESNETEESEGE